MLFLFFFFFFFFFFFCCCCCYFIAFIIDFHNNINNNIFFSLAPTPSTTFQYQCSTRIGYILGLIGSLITFSYASNVIFSKMFKKELTFKQFTLSSNDSNLNHKIILLCILSSLCMYFYLFIYLFVCLFIYLFIYLFIFFNTKMF